MANASNVFRVGGECDHTRTSGNFSLKYVNFPSRKIISDGAFVLKFGMLHILCVPQLGSNSISVMKVRDFLCADDCVILPVCREDEQKLRTVYECCRGLTAILLYQKTLGKSRTIEFL